MLRLALTTGIASLFVVGVMSLGGCPGNNAGEGEGEGEGAAGEGEGNAGEGEGAAGEGEGEGGGEGEGEGAAGDEFCQAACTTDADCSDPTPKCDTTNGVCVAAACTTDDLCTAQNSGWTATACAADADCFGGTGLCVDLDGAGAGTAGGCALAPSGGTCFFGAAVNATDTNGGAISVCGVASTCNQTSKKCEATTSPFACTQDTDCANFATVGFAHCVNNVCGCNGDTDCSAANAAGPKCYSATATCGCGADGDCTGSTTGPTCDTTNGACTCAADGDCGANQSCSVAGTPQ